MRVLVSFEMEIPEAVATAFADPTEVYRLIRDEVLASSRDKWVDAGTVVVKPVASVPVGKVSCAQCDGTGCWFTMERGSQPCPACSETGQVDCPGG